MVRTSVAEEHEYICPRCGSRLGRDLEGRGFVSHSQPGRNCGFDAGNVDPVDDRLTIWHRYATIGSYQAVAIGDYIASDQPGPVTEPTVVFEPDGRRCVVLAIASPNDYQCDVRRRNGTIEEFRIAPVNLLDAGIREFESWTYLGETSFRSRIMVGEPVTRYGNSEIGFGLRPGRYRIETSRFVGNPQIAVRATWLSES